MKRKTLWTAVCLLSVAVACVKQNNPDNGEGQSPSNLSAKGLANCYVVRETGEYRFDATTRGCGAKTPELSDTPVTILPTKAGLIWQTKEGMIGDVKYEDGVIIFTLNSIGGNALIAASNDEGTVLWSWHIWSPEEDITTVKGKNGVEIMNMNLGAMTSSQGEEPSTKPYGMLYQWGRKDPFPSSSTLIGDINTTGAPLYDAEGNTVAIHNSSWTDLACNTVDYAIAFPTICLSNYAHYANSRDWLAVGNDNLWSESKTIFDPCPAGYRVPSSDAFKYFTSSGGYSTDPGTFDVADIDGDGVINGSDYNYGWHFNMAEGSLYFPAAARYDGSYAMLMGSKSGLWGSYWSCNPASSEQAQYTGTAAVTLTFMKEGGNMAVSPSATASKADAYSVRCVKD